MNLNKNNASNKQPPQASTSGGKVKSTSAGRGRWNPYNRFRGRGGGGGLNNAGPRIKPVAISVINSNETASSSASVTSIIPNPADQPIISFAVSAANTSQYSGWQLYFPQEEHRKGSTLDGKIKAAQRHIRNNDGLYDLERIKQLFWFPLVLPKLLRDETFVGEWPTFSQDLQENPEQTLNCLGLAMHQVLLKVSNVAVTLSQSSQSSDTPNLHLKTVRVRLEGGGPSINLRSLKVSSYGRLISIRGTIIRASAAQIICSWMAFKCTGCASEQAIRQTDGIYTMPTSCTKVGCRSRSNFQPLSSSPFTRTEPFQTIRLQESMQGSQSDLGRVPRNIECEMSHDLVDSVCPGDDVTVTGILKVRPQEDYQRKGVASMYKMYLQAVSVSSNKNVITTRKSDFSEKDLEAIRMIKSEPNPFRLLVHSLCPQIYGHEMIKAGLILGLFGGSSDKTAVLNGRRTEAHVLVVGDPGVGKSQMLQACSNVSPRGIFVCGNSSSNAGLTVSVRHDKGTGGSLEAGALVLADQGACCIDEFDKMSSNHQALLEVMEQQTVSVAKAGVLCSLPARTCVLAAANPSGGHYDKSKTVSENIKMNPALLSRFDLVFILLDRPDEHLDGLLTAHIQALHASENPVNPSGSFLGNRSSIIESGDIASSQPLKDRLKLGANEKIDSLPHILMQKYIGYARKNVHPTLSEDAANLLKGFYMEMRKVQHGIDSIPVTTRQLEALIRLTQARARADLCAEASIKHAQDVISIAKYSLTDVFSTNVGTLDMQRNVNGSGVSQASQMKKFINLLQTRSCALNKTVFSMDELRQMAAIGGVNCNLNDLIDSMNLHGFLLRKGMNLYKFLVE